LDAKIIVEYENGKAIPNQQIINKLEKALGAKLREPKKAAASGGAAAAGSAVKKPAAPKKK
jgi:ribosome-binding protein aMBF1 (putative translation factor)